MVLELIYCLIYESAVAKLLKDNLTFYLGKIMIMGIINFIITFLIGYGLEKYLTYDKPILNIILIIILVYLEAWSYAGDKKEYLYNLFFTAMYYCMYGFVSLVFREVMIKILLFNSSDLYMYGFIRTILIIVMNFITYFIVKIMKKYVIKGSLEISSKHLKMHILLFVGIISIIVLLSGMIVYAPSLNIYLILLLMIVVYVICFVIFINLNKIQTDKKINDLVIQNITKENQSNEELRKFKHDIKNKLLALEHLNNEDGVDLYHELTAEISQFKTDIETGNHYLDAIINSKYHEYEDKIKFNWNIKAQENDKIATTDLCSIVYNILDNAVEESLRVNEDSINVFIEYSQNQFIMNVTNATNKKEDSELVTSKSSQNHGYGLLIIKETVAKYKGICDIRIKDNLFGIYVYIALK